MEKGLSQPGINFYKYWFLEECSPWCSYVNYYWERKMCISVKIRIWLQAGIWFSLLILKGKSENSVSICAKWLVFSWWVVPARDAAVCVSCFKCKMKKCARPLWYFGITVNSHTVLAQADGLFWNYLLKELGWSKRHSLMCVIITCAKW